ncbi:MAG: transposase [Deltaproteobacteria bacterium]|nr:MAG: transposase [Deltaproteobacteria bacterium]
MELGRVKIRRQSLRLKDYDYSGPGAYFVTICTRDRLPLFGDIVEGRMRLTEYGRIVSQEWEISATIRQELTLDAFVVMANHVHGVVIIKESNVGATGGSSIRPGPHQRSLGSFLSGFKSATTKRINDLQRTSGLVWQRNYYEHVIRNEQSLHRIREYIATNPARWDFDRENPAATNPELEDVWRG